MGCQVDPPPSRIKRHQILRNHGKVKRNMRRILHSLIQAKDAGINKNYEVVYLI